MTTVALTSKEIAYLLLSLKQYESVLINADETNMSDSVNDLLIVQDLRKKLENAQRPAARAQ